MNKPTPKTFKALDYNECERYIERKYNVDLRDYAGKFKGGDLNEKNTPYLDFWHWILDYNDIKRGSFFYMDFYDAEQQELWIQEILVLFEKEFVEYMEGTCIEFWVDW